MDYLISHIEIVYPEDSTSFIANGSDFDLLIFEKIYGSLSKSEGFLEICSTKSKKKYEDFLEIKNIKR